MEFTELRYQDPATRTYLGSPSIVQLWNVLRCNGKKQGLEEYSLWDRAALVRIEDGGKRLSFDPQNGFIDLPGGHTKYTIRYDGVADVFLMLSNGNLDPEKPTNRSVLSLYKSADRIREVTFHERDLMKRMLLAGSIFLAGCGLDSPAGPREPVLPGAEDWTRKEDERLQTIREECGSWVHPGTICPDDFVRPEAKTDTSAAKERG